jgi:Zn-dependent peptidase ImmA (M78 family)
MTYITKPAMQALINELRAIAPRRPLTYGESIQLARRQAAKLRQWAKADEPTVNLIWLVKQRAVPVNFVPSYKLGEDSGLTTDQIDGRLQMFINQNEPTQRQRFSLLHEFKHALDFDDAAVLHDKLGRGNRKLQGDMIEWIANEFAGHVLMPTYLVKRIWFNTQNLSLAANMFNVSVEAMATRLERLNLIGKPKPVPRMYFRGAGDLPDLEYLTAYLAA